MARVVPARAAQVEERPTATAAISNSRCAASTKARIHHAEPSSETITQKPRIPMLKHAPQTTEETRRSLKWRVVDIARRSGRRRNVRRDVLGVRWHVLWLVSFTDSDTSSSAALLHALFYFPATLGLLIVRKPGASAYVLLVASFVEVVLGTKYSVSLVVIALVQALAAETVFALFRYRRWTLGVTLLAALAVGIVYNFYLLFFYYQAFSFFSPRGLIGTACELLSAVVFAGFGSWVLYRALAKSGVLTRFVSGR